MAISLEPLALLIKRAQYRQNKTIEGALAPLKVSVVQWNALREVQRHPGASMHQLAELTFNSDQAFGTLTARLLRMGYLERKSGPGRALHHTVTPRGKVLLAKGDPLIVEACVGLFAPLTRAERTVLGALMEKLLDAAEEVPAKG